MKKNHIALGILMVTSIMGGVPVFAANIPSKPVDSAQKSTIKKTGATPAGGMMMQAQVPASLTANQKSQLQAGKASHKQATLTFDVTGGSFYFTPNELTVKEGDKVKIVFSNAGGMHNFILPAFNVHTKTIKTGEQDTVEFTANKKGTFEFYCSVGGGFHRQSGQIGVLLVE